LPERILKASFANGVKQSAKINDASYLVVTGGLDKITFAQLTLEMRSCLPEIINDK